MEEGKKNKEKTKKGWERGTAGFFMEENIPIVERSYTIGETLAFVQKNIKSFEKIDYVYVIDRSRKLIGIISYKKLFSHSPKEKIEKVCKKTQLISVRPNDKKEYVAHLAAHNDLVAIPVIDRRKRLLGAITSDKIIQIFHTRRLEELFHMSGIQREHANFENILEIPIFLAIRHRIFWLLIGLVGGIFAAQIIGNFENTLKENLILASFIPLVVYMADAIGTQLEAFAIRDMALFKEIKFHTYFLKQFLIVLIISAILGVVSVIVSLLLYKSFVISIVLGIAITTASLSSIFTGLFIPFLFRKLNKDPANASGPIGTILQDIISVFIYFVIASWML